MRFYRKTNAIISNAAKFLSIIIINSGISRFTNFTMTGLWVLHLANL